MLLRYAKPSETWPFNLPVYGNKPKPIKERSRDLNISNGGLKNIWTWHFKVCLQACEQGTWRKVFLFSSDIFDLFCYLLWLEAVCRIWELKSIYDTGKFVVPEYGRYFFKVPPVNRLMYLLRELVPACSAYVCIERKRTFFSIMCHLFAG